MSAPFFQGCDPTWDTESGFPLAGEFISLERANREVAPLLEENARLRVALEFYARLKNYSVPLEDIEASGNTPVDEDMGDKARAALGEK